MAVTHPELWEQISQTPIGGNDAALFIKKLIKVFGHQRLALDAIKQYKCFLYLAATQSSSVVPCLAVDEVWHLHLTFSHDYWQVWAPLLKKELHHKPSKNSNPTLFRNTITLYQTEFGLEQWQKAQKVWQWQPKHYLLTSIKWLWFGGLIGFAVVQLQDNLNLDYIHEHIIWVVAYIMVLIMSFNMLIANPAKRRRKKGRHSTGASSCGSCSSLSGCSSDNSCSSSSSCGSSCGGGGD